ncbi:hypothetical protein CANCADRAFT_31967 [Tortispora caseinolytica NRRL Y-17796]|uniref:Lysophospholipase n=1 Tax=Tortispora caseinolytica NRRL Y-17796 TaxID=767744 RepID=A0A1E4THP7_9ASCO|nr:hypothetical protein CANCADRAFT_31967 [Tortispora caseinolytica NRRL Y-17796]
MKLTRIAVVGTALARLVLGSDETKHKITLNEYHQGVNLSTYDDVPFEVLLANALDESGINSTALLYRSSAQSAKKFFSNAKANNTLLLTSKETDLTDEDVNSIIDFIYELKEIGDNGNMADGGLERRDASGGYQPQKVTCANRNDIVQNGGDIPESEEEYVQKRLENAKEHFKAFLKESSNLQIDVDAYINAEMPRIALAFSGGGFRAMTCGAGSMVAMDARTPGAVGPNQLGGLLQSSAYVAGASGGSWLVASSFAHGYVSPLEIIKNNGWQLQNFLLAPKSGVIANVKFFYNIYKALKSKKEVAPVTVVDIWGRFLAYQLLESDSSSVDVTLNKLLESSAFTAFEAPVPFLTSTMREDVNIAFKLDSPIFSFSPFGTGTTHRLVNGYVDTKYLGSGSNQDNNQCVEGYDNLGFLMGTSANVFPAIPDYIVTLIEQIDYYFVRKVILAAFKALRVYADAIDFSKIKDNTFKGLKEYSRNFDSDSLLLADGGISGQNLPLYPLLNKKRKVDVIFAFDNTDDTSEKYPDGTTLETAYNAATYDDQVSMPTVPTVAQMNSTMLEHPIFFGCNQPDTPLIVYLPNTHFTDEANYSTLKLQYTKDELAGMMNNAYNILTQGNNTLAKSDVKWTDCARCATILRTSQHHDLKLPDTCQQCFSEYCYGGF